MYPHVLKCFLNVELNNKASVVFVDCNDHGEGVEDGDSLILCRIQKCSVILCRDQKRSVILPTFNCPQNMRRFQHVEKILLAYVTDAHHIDSSRIVDVVLYYLVLKIAVCCLEVMENLCKRTTDGFHPSFRATVDTKAITGTCASVSVVVIYALYLYIFISFF